MRPLATFIVRVFFLFSLWGGALNAQTLSQEPEKDLAWTVLATPPFYSAGNNFSTSITDSFSDNHPIEPLSNQAIHNEGPVEIESTDFFCPLPPVITSFSPETGTVGTTVTITGSGFDPTPANNIVYFGATRAVVSAATATSLTVTVPYGATYQFITVTTPCNLCHHISLRRLYQSYRFLCRPAGFSYRGIPLQRYHRGPRWRWKTGCDCGAGKYQSDFRVKKPEQQRNRQFCSRGQLPKRVQPPFYLQW
jgi:hypothetical protein